MNEKLMAIAERVKLVHGYNIANEIADIARDDGWIAGLPDEDGKYLCYRPDAVVDARRVQTFKRGRFDGIYDVTHYMVLPTPPKESVK